MPGRSPWRSSSAWRPARWSGRRTAGRAWSWSCSRGGINVSGLHVHAPDFVYAGGSIAQTITGVKTFAADMYVAGLAAGRRVSLRSQNSGYSWAVHQDFSNADATISNIGTFGWNVAP